MSTSQPGTKPTDPGNPYNIDFAREHRLKRIFQVTIGVGFVIAAIMLIIGYALDVMLADKLEGNPPVTPYSTPAQSRDQPVVPR